MLAQIQLGGSNYGGCMKYRHKVEYTENPFHDTYYSEEFSDIESSQVMLNTVCWHIGAKCGGSFAISKITLQCKESDVCWEDVT